MSRNRVAASDLFQQLLAMDESEKLEAKRGQNRGKSVLETICAFSNEPHLGGGDILLGVKRIDGTDAPLYTVEGIDNPDKISADIASQCASEFNRPIRVDITTDKIEQKTVMVIHVFEAEPNEKPIYFKATGLPRGAFRRIGSTDQRCTDDDMAELYRLQRNESFDGTIIESSDLTDIDDDAVEAYRRDRAEVNPDAEELLWSDEELLQALNAIAKTPNGVFKPTVAGIVLFGKPQALRRLFPLMRVDYIRVAGNEWVSDPEHRFESSVELRDSLFKLLRRAQAAILDDMPKAFEMADGKLQRGERPTIPQRVIREAVVNALLHRCYRTNEPVQIIRYSNRLEIRNPGYSMKSEAELGEPGSIARNPYIAAVLNETRFAETKGSGIRVIKQSMNEAGLLPPVLESDRGANRFVARFLFTHLLDETRVRWLKQFKALELSNADAMALIVAHETGRLDNSTYRSLNSVDALTASDRLKRLRNADVLLQKGGGAKTYYVLNDAFAAPVTQRQVSDFVPSHHSAPEERESEPLTTKSEPLTTKSELLTTKSEPLTTKLVAISDEKTENDASSIPEALQYKLENLGKRGSPADIRALVLDLCAVRPLSTRELAEMLNRQPATVRQDYIAPLLTQKRLEMTLPNKPSSRSQRYRTTKREER